METSFIHESGDAPGRSSLRDLADRIESIESPERSAGRHNEGLNTGWSVPGPDDMLCTGAIHEWFGTIGEPSNHQWTPPLLLMVHLAKRAIKARSDRSQRVLWIGRRVHPAAAVLLGNAHPRLLERSLFVDVDDVASRVWAIDLALRCPAVALVIADGSAVAMPHSRRLQLAAQSNGRRGIGLLVRPPHELTVHSCAATRWTVARAPSPTAQPRWRLTCVRCKGVQRQAAMDASAENILLERDRVSDCLHLVSDAANRSDQAASRELRIRCAG